MITSKGVTTLYGDVLALDRITLHLLVRFLIACGMVLGVSFALMHVMRKKTIKQLKKWGFGRRA
jgi:hypothetical protein